MFKKIFSIAIIFFGIILVYISIKNNKNKSCRTNLDGNDNVNRFIKYETISDVLSGIAFIILGAISLLDILSGENVGLISSIIVLINRIIDLMISKKFNIRS